jgi:predicted amidohydrolase YtcJ
VPLAAGTDAPFGDPDPWRAMCAAVTRRSETGICLGPEERISPESALALFGEGCLLSNGISHPVNDRRRQRTMNTVSALAIGQPADLCLLKAPWQEVRQSLSREHVAATLCAGRVIWSGDID